MVAAGIDGCNGSASCSFGDGGDVQSAGCGGMGVGLSKVQTVALVIHGRSVVVIYELVVSGEMQIW